MQEIILPALGQSVEEASIVTWLKKEGDNVKTGEPICTIQTDKAEIECESTADGVLRKILVQPDVFVPVMSPIALVGDAEESLPDLSKYGQGASGGEPAPQASSEDSAVSQEKAPAQETEETPAPERAMEVPDAAPPGEAGPVSPRARRVAKELHINPKLVKGSGVGGRVIEEDIRAYEAELAKLQVTSVARQIAEQEGVDIRQVQGTGPGGRITKEDVLKAAEAGVGIAPEPEPAMEAMTAPGPATGQSIEGGGRTPLTPMRRIIAERMVESKFSAPHYYVTVEIDMKAATDFRSALSAFKPSFNDMIIRATARAIQRIPSVNVKWAGDAIEKLEDINVGFAVALPDGLITPVIRQCQQKSLHEIHRESRELLKKAKGNKLTPNDYTGSTFTISNLGGFGVDNFTAIINQPNTAILAVGQIKDQVVVIDGGMYIRPMMKATLSSDHRAIDGAIAAQFMGALKEILENSDL